MSFELSQSVDDEPFVNVGGAALRVRIYLLLAEVVTVRVGGSYCLS